MPERVPNRSFEVRSGLASYHVEHLTLWSLRLRRKPQFFRDGA